MTGAIPPQLGNLLSLRLLSLSGTTVTGTIPPELGGLADLRELRLAATSLTGAIPPELGDLVNLNSLVLAFNGLTGTIPPELGDLANLEILWLDQNQLTGPIPPELGDLANLEALSIIANKFEEGSSDSSGPPATGLTGSIPPELGNLPNLEILRLSQNSLTGSIPPGLGNLSNLKMLSLAKNELAGDVPASLGRLVGLEELNLAHNTGLTGVLPAELTKLGMLNVFLASGTGLCVPSDPVFTDWLSRLTRRRIAICQAEQAVAYLTQAVQSRTFPVPLVAGEAALLRVFVTAPGGSDAHIPPVRASFYLGGAETHVVEMVIEIDPDSTLGPSLGIARRIPERGRTKVDVREMPPFKLTVIPFLWSEDPDSSVLEIGGADDDFFWATRTLLPVGEFEVEKHEPVLTSSQDIDRLLEETRAIRVMEGGTGYYLGIMSGEADGAQGAAELSAPLAFAVTNPFIVAHELGHNMGLLHAPCGGPFADTGYPQPDGSIGAFGYDFRDGGQLVPPSTPDLMTYCGPPWIGDYNFGNALAFRLLKEREATMAAEELTRTILLWGGVDDAGVPFLEPTFVVDAPPSLPRSGGDYEITGRSEGGDTLFSLRFDMPRMADGGGRSSFAFALPVRPAWATALASITLTGPGGSVVLDAESHRPMAILRDSGTGRVLAIHRDPPRTEAAREGVDAVRAAWPGLQELFSRGVPDAAAWNP